ncbi:MAG: hypothetical protein M0Z77_04450 [Thermoplasmatales archaeon]|nr:hypothetical protein [Thermoplasmatales archaeon]
MTDERSKVIDLKELESCKRACYEGAFKLGKKVNPDAGVLMLDLIDFYCGLRGADTNIIDNNFTKLEIKIKGSVYG